MKNAINDPKISANIDHFLEYRNLEGIFSLRSSLQYQKRDTRLANFCLENYFLEKMSKILAKKPDSGQTVLIVSVVIIQNLIVSNFEEKYHNTELNCILRDFMG